jgi:hypothetical protein
MLAKEIVVIGGPVQNLCDVADGRGGAWNREGVIVFAPSGTSSRLQRVPAVSCFLSDQSSYCRLQISAKRGVHCYPEGLRTNEVVPLAGRPSNPRPPVRERKKK